MAFVIIGNGRAQRHDAQGRTVAAQARLRRSGQRVDHDRRRRKIRLPDTKADNIAALFTQLLGGLGDLDRMKSKGLVDSVGKTGHGETAQGKIDRNEYVW